MSSIMLSKQTDAELTEQQRKVLRETLFGMVDGMSEADKKMWRRFWNWVMQAGSGEMFSIETWTPRNGRFHRRHMLMETKVFQAQERIKNFEQFRTWIKLGAGFCDWMAGPKGGVVPVPKSISYKKCDEDVMRQFHEDAVAFLRTPHAQKYLWPHLSPFMAEQSIEVILSSFERRD